MLRENLVTRRVREENASKSSLTCRVTKQGHFLLAALGKVCTLASKPRFLVHRFATKEIALLTAPQDFAHSQD